MIALLSTPHLHNERMEREELTVSGCNILLMVKKGFDSFITYSVLYELYITMQSWHFLKVTESCLASVTS